MIKKVLGRRASFCSPACIEQYERYRERGFLQPQYSQKDGTIISIEKASIKYNFCVNCYDTINTIKERIDEIFDTKKEE
jgi:hypothetical protein